MATPTSNETIRAEGHKNITARHRTTLEITTDRELTKRGDCIIAVSADKRLNDLSEKFKSSMRDMNATLRITIACDGVEDTVIARGHPDLILDHPTDMVVRKSDFICPRTLAICADKAASDLKSDLIERLKQSKDITVYLEIY